MFHALLPLFLFVLCTPKVVKKRKMNGPDSASSGITQAKVGVLVGKGKPFTLLIDEAETICEGFFLAL